MIEKYEEYRIDIQALDVFVEYGNCGSHLLHLHVKIWGEQLEKLKTEIAQAERSKEIEFVQKAAEARTRVIVTDEETKCDCYPHGPEQECTCEGCWACSGHVIGCTCDINWDCEHRDR